ncbi:DUF222 domain-containing protein [Rathayibacter soli]|uniref:DUF222 domain-containing protein n=1 Tax=Rathayibacter soli TaxID=3144168 RepID=UPI0027E551E3|nr:DUF222 domain-containing protein [Glaciibacter superstes]
MALISQQVQESALRVSDLLAAHELPDVADSVPTLVSRFDDDGVQSLVAAAAAMRSEADAIIAAGAGVIASRSDRELGYSGLAARLGQRSPVDLVQSITGSSRVEAARQVRLGEAMGEADAATRLIDAAEQTPTIDKTPDADTLDETNGTAPDRDLDGDSTADPGDGCGQSSMTASVIELPWFEPITRAVAERMLTAPAAEAMIRGLGLPNDDCDSDVLRAAAEELLVDAASMNTDALTRRARLLRDRLDPAGVTERAERRYAARKWRFGRKADGVRTAWIEFDDESAAWMDTIVSAGMRPRRGGPRFVDKAEADAAEKLRDDPRTNDQLVFDLLMDVLRAGAVADPSTGFGSRQPGLRVVITKTELDKHDLEGNVTGTGYLEDTGEAVPPAMIERLLCDVGTRDVTFDQNGNPLDVGREQRLFTAKQRVALAIRDGGCMHPDCDRPPSYAEAHHIDHWHEHHGRTDIASGILLCRYHHMLIHNQHWRIRREGSVYWLVPPRGDERQPIRLRSKAAWWQDRKVG